MKITRKQIINELKHGLEKSPSIFAFWLEGADALDSVDKYSDLDIWIDVRDGQENKIMKELENILSRTNPLDFSYEVDHPHPKIRQKFFHIKGTSEFLVIDICLQSHSRKFYYELENEGEKVNIIFDKKNVIRFQSIDKKKLRKSIHGRIKELKKTFPFFYVWVKKEVERKDFLEALEYYHQHILRPLVEILRIKYQPTKKDFHMKHIAKDLPQDVLKKVEDLYKISSIKDIKLKSQKANKLFSKTVSEIEKSGLN